MVLKQEDFTEQAQQALRYLALTLTDTRLMARLVKIGSGTQRGRCAFPGSLVGDDEALEVVAYREDGR